MELKERIFQQTVAFLTSAHNLQSEFTKVVPKEDVTPLQFDILIFLCIQQPLTPSQISDCMNMSMPNTSRELRKLTERGLCEKYSDAMDRRKQYIRLSQSGWTYMEGAFDQMKQELNKRLDSWTVEELENISQALGLLQSTLFRTPAVQVDKLLQENMGTTRSDLEG